MEPKHHLQLVQRLGAIYTLAECHRGGNALPIELVSFVAESREKDVELRWTTATEINNDFFTVERSRDGLHFEAVHKPPVPVTRPPCSITRLTISHPSTASFYRLRQTDSTAGLPPRCGDRVPERQYRFFRLP